jgi:hypothetical protein
MVDGANYQSQTLATYASRLSQCTARGLGKVKYYELGDDARLWVMFENYIAHGRQTLAVRPSKNKTNNNNDNNNNRQHILESYATDNRLQDLHMELFFLTFRCNQCGLRTCHKQYSIGLQNVQPRNNGLSYFVENSECVRNDKCHNTI